MYKHSKMEDKFISFAYNFKIVTNHKMKLKIFNGKWNIEYLTDGISVVHTFNINMPVQSVYNNNINQLYYPKENVFYLYIYMNLYCTCL